MFDLENFPTRELARDMMGMISPIYDNLLPLHGEMSAGSTGSRDFL